MLVLGSKSLIFSSDKRHLLLFRKKYSRWDICFSRAEGVTRYVESVPRSRLMASPALDMTQLAFVCKHPRRDWSVALRLSYSRVRQTTLSTCPVIGNKSNGVTSPEEKPSVLITATSRASVEGLQEI